MRYFSLMISIFLCAQHALAAGGVCVGDAGKFCSDVSGDEKIGRCLRQHMADLSAGCKALQEQNIISMAKGGHPIGEGMSAGTNGNVSAAAPAEKGSSRKPACFDDARKYCQGVRPGGGGLIKCLRRHESELSPACRTQAFHR